MGEIGFRVDEETAWVLPDYFSGILAANHRYSFSYNYKAESSMYEIVDVFSSGNIAFHLSQAQPESQPETVPDPGTFLLVFSGLCGICFLARANHSGRWTLGLIAGSRSGTGLSSPDGN
jgi:hypothetical protein